MGMYRTEWDCCGSITETDAWAPEDCPFCEKPLAHRQNHALLKALKNVTVHLIAAHSLLQRGGKRAAASDTMFSMMLEDYEKSFEVGRAAIKAVEEGK